MTSRPTREPTPAPTPQRPLVIGLGVSGRAMVAGLVAHGSRPTATDDHPSAQSRATAESLGVQLIERPSTEQLVALVEAADAVLPSPGVPDAHPAMALAARAGVPVLSEYDLAGGWDDRPVLAITGTNGKTTVTTLVTEMLNASGRRAMAAGNIEIPLVQAIERPDVDVFVVEASSFQLGHTQRFTPAVATWLNFAPDHLDVHDSLERYEAAKARIWRDLDGEAVAVANADDPVVAGHVGATGRAVTFGLGPEADFHLDGDRLVTVEGSTLVERTELWRDLPHDVANALAASATALAGGATLDGVRAALTAFRGLPHRVELVGEWDGVRWYDDSKATAPHATLAALEGFPSVVLIAGGRNKGLDLAPLRAAAGHLRAVVAIGEAAPAVRAAFAGTVPVHEATTDMAQAVRLAADAAVPGDIVLLSPGCASFDWYASYHERGQDFQAAVRSGRDSHEATS